MTGKDKHKKSSHHSKSGSTSTSSHHKKSSSSSDPKTSSSHRHSSSRATRDTRPDTTQDDDEEEYDGLPYSEEGRQEGYTQLAYTRGDDAAGATQQLPATTGYYDPYNQSEQVRNQAQQPGIGSTGLQSGTIHEDARRRQNPQPSEAASSRVPATAYQNASWQPSQLQQPSYASSPSYVQSTGTQQPPGDPGATGQPYSATPGYSIQRTPGGTILGGPTAPTSVAATGPPLYYYSSSSTTDAVEGPNLGPTADTRRRPWQDLPARSRGAARNEDRTMDDEVNRVRNEDDNTGS